MIGTTRKVNEESKTIDWIRLSSHGQKEKPTEQKESVIYRIHAEKETGKTIFQIGTADPERAVAAARLVAADVAGIDVNAGCPKPFSTSGGMGAALLREPDKLCAILEALVKNITPEFDIGISVKIRILETPAETEALVRRLVSTGITGLTVHCRTTPMRPRERAIREQLRMVADVCREAGVACLMNGDVEDKDQGLSLAQEYGADGAMIAVAAERNPSCFRTRDEGGILPWQPVVEEFIKTALDIDNRWGNTKFLLSQMVPGKSSLYQPTVQTKNYVDLCTVHKLDHLMEQARKVDSRIGLDELPAKAAKKAKGNSSARAAGGKMGRDKANRKPLSERKVTTQKKPELAPIALGAEIQS